MTSPRVKKAVKAWAVLSALFALSACGEGSVFVWRVEDVVALSILGLCVAAFLLFWAIVYVLVAWDWVKRKFKRQVISK